VDQFTVPQFIDREAKILGPITVRQFIICLVGAGFIFLAYKLSDFSLFIVLAVIIAIIFGGLAFIKINSRPLHYFLLAFVNTSRRPAVRVWKKDIKSSKVIKKEPTTEEKIKAETKAKKKQISQILAQKKLAKSRLSKLSLTVDTGGKYRDVNKNSRPK